jgi:hypothetical protein
MYILYIMGGGLMQLVAMGAQDVFLTGNPQITFFKVVYRRHTNFSKECIAQQFNGNVALDGQLTCTLARNGDLVQEIYLKTGLSSNQNYTATTARDMNNLIDTVEVEIGGQKIDKHYAAWLDIYNELFEPNIEYLEMMTNLNANGSSTAVSKTLYIPLRFWFNRNAGLALPLIALQYHEVKILLKLNNQNAIVTGNTLVSNQTELLVNYIYLDTDERRRFAQVSHEYLIEQVQHTGPETLATGAVNGHLSLNFNHPVKALFWTTNGVQWINNIKLQLNGHDRFSEQPGDYFHLLQPYECGLGNRRSLSRTTRVWGDVTNVSVTNPIGMYSFCLKPGEHQPSGSCNFSRIDNARLSFTGGTGSSSTDNLHLFALNYNVLRIMSGMGGLTYSN